MELKQDSSGNLICATKDLTFTFREPKGKDLITLQRKMTEDSVAMEIMVIILEVLSDDGLTADDFLEMPADLTKDLGEAVVKTFRVFGLSAV